ncbi:MAG TPA: dioxygenase [Stellaceae bacterium]|nr:dioxygenase [Stellaceae bacterium]
MRDVDQHNITEAVLETLAKTPDPRLKHLITRLVHHLHDYAREVKLTPAEWLAAVKFLTATGKASSPERQEMILLSDIMGLSMLVTVMQRRPIAGTTTTSVIGPFYRDDAPHLPFDGNIAEGEPGETLHCSGRILDTAGKPVANAVLDVWQAASDGIYDSQRADPSPDLRAQFRTDLEGRYSFRTVLPIGYSVPVDGPVGDLLRALHRHAFRPAHIHFMLHAEGYDELISALYVEGDPYIDSDTVFGVSKSLVARVEPASGTGRWPKLRRIRYDFVLANASTESLVETRKVTAKATLPGE